MKAKTLIEQLVKEVGFSRGLVEEVLYALDDSRQLDELSENLEKNISYTTMEIGFYPEGDSILIGVPFYNGIYYGPGERVDKYRLFALLESYKSVLDSTGELVWEDSEYTDYFMSLSMGKHN